MSTDVHRLLVEALEEPESLAEMGDRLSLPPAAWAAAVERARAARFPGLPPVQGYRRIGEQLGEAFLRGPVGAIVNETLPIVSMERACGSLIPLLGERLRGTFDVQWTVNEAGGLVRVDGPIVLSAEVTAGMLEHLGRRIDSTASVEVASSSAMHFELQVSWRK